MLKLSKVTRVQQVDCKRSQLIRDFSMFLEFQSRTQVWLDQAQLMLLYAYLVTNILIKQTILILYMDLSWFKWIGVASALSVQIRLDQSGLMLLYTNLACSGLNFRWQNKEFLFFCVSILSKQRHHFVNPQNGRSLLSKCSVVSCTSLPAKNACLCKKEILTHNAFLFNQMNCNNLSLNNHTRQAIWTNHPSHLIS